MSIRLTDQNMRPPEGEQLLAPNGERRRWYMTMIIMLAGILLIGLGTLHPDVSGHGDIGKIRIVILLFFLAFLAIFLFVLRGLATWPGFLLAIDGDELVYPLRRSFFNKWGGRYAAIDTGSLIRVDTKYPDQAGIRLFVREENAHLAHTEPPVGFEPLVGWLGRPPTKDHVLIIGFPTGSRKEAEKWAEIIRKLTEANSFGGESPDA